ncbi:MAG: C-terminal helicase domain-containing protein [Acidimicrobiales bacterium]
MAERADQLAGTEDAKLAHTAKLVRQVVAEGYNPIVFCRFIPTADYVAEHLPKALGDGVAVDSVTGVLPPAKRESWVTALGEAARRELFATDCLSEAVNLQECFDAVVHYDLPWNPTASNSASAGSASRSTRSRWRLSLRTSGSTASSGARTTCMPARSSPGPWAELKCTIDPLDDEDRRLVLGANAAALYGLTL